MSLLLLFAGEAIDPSYTSPIAVQPWGIDIRVGTDPLGRRGPVRRPLGINPLRNQYVRAIDNFDISYQLGNRWILHCQTVDPVDDPTNGYRPGLGDRVTIATTAGAVLFFGKVADTRESSIQKNSRFGVEVDIDAINDWEAFEHTILDRTFGSDKQDLLWVSSGTGTMYRTVEPHPFQTGDLFTAEGIVNGAPNVNGTFMARRVDNFHFAVDTLNGAGQLGSSGSVRGRFYLRDAVNYIVGRLSTFGIVVDPSMELGPLMEKIVMESSAADALKALQEQSGWVYRLLPTNVLEMFQPGTRVATFTLNGSNIIGAPTISRSRQGYANVVEVLYGGSQTAAKTDRFVSDGSNRTFELTYRPATGFGLASPGKVLLYGSSPMEGPIQEVEVKRFGAFTGDWLYNAEYGAHGALYYNGTTVPAFGFYFGFEYDVAYPQKLTVKAAPAVITEDMGEIVRRFEAPDIFDLVPAQEFGNQMLAHTTVKPRKVTITTRAGLALPGSTVTLSLASRNLSGANWLITTVAVREDADGSFRYTYTLLEDNEIRDGWIEYLKGLREGSPARSSSASRPSPGTSGGGGGMSGGGTPNKIAKWISTAAIGDSQIEDIGSSVNVAAPLVVSATASANAFRGRLSGGSDLTLQNVAGTNVMTTTPGTTNVGFAGSVTIQSILSSASSIVVQPALDLVLNPGTKFVRPASNYGADLGTFVHRFRSAWIAELQAETLVARETIATIGGTILVGPTTELVADVSAAASVIVTKHNDLFTYDTIYLKKDLQMEMMLIAGPPSGNATVGWSYPVVRDRDGSGPTPWPAGSAVFNTGIPAGGRGGPEPASGFMDIYSVRSIRGAEWGPTIVGNVRHGYGAFDYAPRWAIGNLKGQYGYSGDVHGVAMGKYLDKWITIDDSLGIRIMQGGASQYKLWIHPDGNAYFYGVITAIGGNVAFHDLSNVTTIDGGKITTNSITASKINVGALSALQANVGNLIINAGGNITTAGMGWGAGGPGVFLGWNGAGYAFAVGNWAGNRMYFDHVGNLIVVSNYIAFGSITMDPNGITIPSGSAVSGSRIWIGGAVLHSNASGQLSISGGLIVSDDVFFDGDFNCHGQVWFSDYVEFTAGVDLTGTNLNWSTPPSTDANDYPLVWSGGNHNVYYKTDGYDGTISLGLVSQIHVERGIVTGAS